MTVFALILPGGLALPGYSDLIRILLIALIGLGSSGCMVGYLAKSGYHQAKILNSRQDLDKVLKDPKVPSEVKEKLRLVRQVKQFAEKELGLEKTDNYQSYVDLQRPYVSWIVRVAHAHKLEPYLWSFPLVGDLPYKGYFSPDEAKEEATTFDSEKYDTYVRGATAYSTLGWFEDPILSSMLRYKNYDLVNLIIHETVHATIYIKGQADFNEQLATFLGDKGTEMFYLALEGPQSAALQQARLESQDQKTFSQFISKEIESMRQWYKDRNEPPSKNEKQSRLNLIQQRFAKEVKPLLHSGIYRHFDQQSLNNAKLLSLQTYLFDLSSFERLYQVKNQSYSDTLEFCKGLAGKKDPKGHLEKFLESHDPKSEIKAAENQ